MPIKGEALKRPSGKSEVMIDAPLVCQELCQQSPNCNGFTYVGGATKGEDRPDAQACYLKRERRMDDKDAHNANLKGYVTGPKGCGQSALWQEHSTPRSLSHVSCLIDPSCCAVCEVRRFAS